MFFAFTFLLTFSFASAQQSNGGFADLGNRKPVDPDGPIAKLVGLITQVGAKGEEYGNGFVVGAEGCHVLTNFHVAFGKSVDRSSGEIEMVENVEGTRRSSTVAIS